MPTLTETFRNHDNAALSGGLCTGDACRGWHYSDLDTWHECRCNAEKGRMQPEDEEAVGGQVYAVSIELSSGRRQFVSYYVRLDHARKALARKGRAWAAVNSALLQRRVGVAAVAEVALQVARWEDLCSD